MDSISLLLAIFLLTTLLKSTLLGRRLILAFRYLFLLGAFLFLFFAFTILSTTIGVLLITLRFARLSLAFRTFSFDVPSVDALPTRIDWIEEGFAPLKATS
jgi:hypothetical protein